MDIDRQSQRTRSRSTLPLVAALWATVVGVYLLIAATQDRSFAIITSAPPPTYEVVKNKLLDYASIVAVTGFDSASGLFIPTLLALCPLAFRKHRRGALLLAGGLTLAVCLIWPFSIGVLYLPTALLLLFAAVRTNQVYAHAIQRQLQQTRARFKELRLIASRVEYARSELGRQAKLHRTRLIEILGELLLQFVLDFLGQLLFEIVAAIATDAGKRIRGQRGSSHPILAYTGAVLLGAAAGWGSAQLFPQRIVHNWPLPGFSLVAAPLAIGVVMRAYGHWRERHGHEANLFATYWGASTSAFAFALVRFLLVR